MGGQASPESGREICLPKVAVQFKYVNLIKTHMHAHTHAYREREREFSYLTHTLLLFSRHLEERDIYLILS